MTDIYYDAVAFPASLGLSASGVEFFPFAEIVWAAATIGQTPFSTPVPLPDLAFEFIWRAAMVWANLTPGVQVHRSAAYQRLDPSEKSAVSFFLGQVQAKLFAHRLFNVDIFVHLDRVLEILGEPRAKARPDFVGFDPALMVSVAVEAKGRSHGWTTHVVTAAKAQAAALPAVVGTAAVSRYAHVAYFDGDEWRARLVDPPRARNVVQDLAPDAVRRAYYTPLAGAFALLKSRELPDQTAARSLPPGHRWVRVDEARCYLGLNESALDAGGVIWQETLGEQQAQDPADDDQWLRTRPDLYFAGKDGVAILLDTSWLEWGQLVVSQGDRRPGQ